MQSRSKILLLVVFTLVTLAIVATLTLKAQRQRPPVKAANHPARQIAMWLDRLTLPIEAKFFEAPPELLDYLLLDNKEHGWPNVPQRVVLTPERQAQLQKVVSELPENVKAFTNRKLAGVFIVKDLGGSGYTESVLDEQGAPAAGIIVLDELVFNKKANEWATWKERSPFTDPGDLKVTIEPPEGDTAENALQYILLHEFGHVSAIGTDLQPRQDTTGGEDADPARFVFSKLSWRMGGEDFTVIPSEEFEERPHLAFYRGGLKTDVEALYRKLERTSFPTLYASTNFSDDWADSFASYIHVVLLKKPYAVEVGSFALVPCWGTPRCAAKEAVLVNYLSGTSR